MLGGVSFVARLALELTSPDGPRFGGPVGDGSPADYTLWPFGSILAPINPGFIEAAESDSQPTLPDGGGAPAPVPTVLIAAPTATPTPPLVTAEPSPSPSATVAPALEPTAAPSATITPTRTPVPIQAPTVAAAPTRTALPRPTATPAQPSATPVTRPEDQPPPPTAAPSATPRPTNTALPTTPPPPASTPLPTNPPASPIPPPPVVGTPTNTPLPTSTPEPPRPSLAFADEAIAVSEEQGEATLVVRLSGSYFRPVTVAYSTVGGSAAAGVDYTATSGTLTFSPGQVARTIKIPIGSDGRNEPNETIIVQLSGLSNATLGGADIAVVTITDSDPPPTVSFVGSGRTVAESGGSAAFTVELSQSADLAVAVPYTVGGTASVGDAGQGTGDHNLRAGVAVIPAGATSARVRFAIFNDLIDEDDETVQVNLGTPLNADLVDPTVYVVTITDDDTAGVQIKPNSFTLNEGQSGSYTVVLDSEPTQRVTVQLKPDGQLGTDRAELTFTPLDWSRPQAVTLTALDDDVDEPDQHQGRLEHVVVSNDPRYNRIDLRSSLSITATIADNDTAGVLVGATAPLTVTESLGINHTATYTIALLSQPTAPVTITLSPVTIGINAQVVVSPAQLVFDASSWRTAQTVTVSALDDDYDEADPHPGRITHAVKSTDPKYHQFAVANVDVNVLDDDTAGLSIGAMTPPSVSESPALGNTATYSVALTSQPTATVTITLASDSQLGVSPVLLQFEPASWNVTRTVTVTAVNDDLDEADLHTGVITHTASSTDPNFRRLTPYTTTVTISDDDTSDVIIDAPLSSVGEGETITYTVRLASQPRGTVTLDLVDSPAGLVTVNPVVLDFDATDWMKPAVVSVTADQGDNDLIEGSRPFTISHMIVASDDPIYEKVGPRALDLTVIDDDVAGLAFTGDEITEGVPGIYSIALTSRPSDAVTVTLSLPPGIEGNPATLVFSPDTWAVSQTVTVTATDDAIASGNRQAPIVHSLSSADANFNGAGPFTHTLMVLEDDVAGLSLGLSTTEILSESQAPTQTATFTVALTSEPTATVTLDLLTPDGQLVVSPAALSFDQISWNMPQTVTVTALNDGVAETNPHTGTIELTSTSADLLYNRTWPARPELEFAIADDDTASILVSEPMSRATSESGLAVTFEIRLTSEPATPVSIPVTLSALAEATLSVEAPWSLPLVFDKSNWQTVATVTVRGLDDSAYDGRQPFQVLIGRAQSPGSGYDGKAPALGLIDLWNDDDEPALASIDDAAAVAEGDGGEGEAIFPVTLRRPATVTTTVSYATYELTATELDDYAATTGVITFTPGITGGVIAVPVYGDKGYEPDEIFGVRLTGVSAPGDISGLDDTHAIGTIANDDPAGLRFDVAETLVREGDGEATLVVRLEEAQGNTVTVKYSTLGTGTAAAPGDYFAQAGVLTFEPGVVTQTITLAIIDDGVAEELFETARVVLSDPAAIALSSPSEATVTILDDDRATPLATPLFLVTGGPDADETNGYYYTGGSKGYGYVIVSIPCSWPGTRPLSIELWSPAMHTVGYDIEGKDNVPGATTFELYDLGLAAGGSLTPAAGTGGATTYAPSGAPEGWATLSTIGAPTPCGRYALRAEASGDDENYWAVRAGYDADGSPLTPPDPTAGDERVTMASIGATFEHRAADEATTLWFYVAPGTETLLLRNFDLDSGAGGTPQDKDARVSYYGPGAAYDPLGITGGITGTASSSVDWSEDLVSRPRAGWWRAVIFTGAPENAYIFEARADGAQLPIQLEPSLEPEVSLSLTPSQATAAPGDELTLTLTYQSLGQTTAMNPTLTLALPGDLTFAGDPCAGVPAGCSWSPAGTLTLATGALAPGDAGTLSFNVIVDGEAQGTAAISLGASFGDVAGNRFRASTGAVVEVPE